MMSKTCVLRRFRVLLAACLAVAALSISLPVQAAEPVIITSASKQFIVRGLPQRSLLAGSGRDDLIYLDPSLLAVTCERVRESLNKELGWGERWHATVVINIHPIRFDNETPELRVLRTADGWKYRLDLPDEIDRTRLLQSLVETLLLEYANRGARDQSVSLPPWLTEGLTAHMMQGPLAALAIQPRAVNLRHGGKRDPNNVLRRRMQASGVLTVDQLNWPEFDRDDEKSAEAYHYSAHMFVRELIRLRGGTDCLCAMLAMLPEHLNWQTAFLRAFESHFRRMIDAEKWWALTTTQLKAHDTSLHWSLSEAQQKLDEILYTAVEVRLTRQEMPHVAPVSLQTVISGWEFAQQTQLLQAKLNQFQMARLRWPPELSPTVESYRAVIEKYLRLRKSAWLDATAAAAAREAVAQLTALDEQRTRNSAKVLTAAAGPETGEVPLTPR
jgi:hypothetical protein